MFDFRGMMFDVQASAKEFLFLSVYYTIRELRKVSDAPAG